MNKKIKKAISKDTIPFIILLIAFIFIHIKMNTNFGDDIHYREHYVNIVDTLINYYKIWGSPSLPNAVLYLFIKLPDTVFKIFNILFILLTGYSILKITYDENSKHTNWIIVFFIMLYPFTQMGSAGWISTSSVYLFPISFGLYSLVYLRFVIDDKTLVKLNYFLFWTSLLIGLGNLQMSCIIFGIYAIFNIFFALKGKVYKFSIFQNVTALLFIVYHVTSPGNANRSIQETARWFPDFNMISTVNKIKLGFTSTLGNLISGPNLFFLCFTCLLVIGVYCKYKNVLYRAISLIPFLSSLLFGGFIHTFSDLFSSLIVLMNNGSYDFLQINLYNFYSKTNYISIILGFTILGAILTSIYLIFENTLKMLTVEIIFLAGFCSRMIMSFSPTIYASSTRTFIFFYFAIIICATLIFNNVSENITEEKQKELLMYIGVISVINYLQLLINI